MVGYSNILVSLTPEHVPAIFFQFHVEERWIIDVQTRRDISRMAEDGG